MVNITDNAAKYIIVNGDLMDTSLNGDENSTPNIVLPFEGDQVYEVIRFVGRKPLFIKDHYSRMENSAHLSDIVNILGYNEVLEYSRILLETNLENDCNVKMICTPGIDAENYNFVLYISKSFYPDVEMYQNGVNTNILQCERDNPNAKISKVEYIEKISLFKSQNDIFEVLLFNQDNQLTEGSKSNLFFIIDEVVYTAPENMILKGVMRNYVLEACNKLNIQVVQKAIDLDSLDKVDAAFLTGTSIKVLPIVLIGEKHYCSSQNQVFLKISKEFNNIINNYLNKEV